MKTVDLKHFPYFREGRFLQELNHHVEIHVNLMPHQVAVATGCGVDEAMGVLLLLFGLSMVEAWLLVYHNVHLDGPVIMARSVFEGPPSLPFVCEICGTEIENGSELSYEFLFKKTNDIHFVV